MNLKITSIILIFQFIASQSARGKIPLKLKKWPHESKKCICPNIQATVKTQAELAEMHKETANNIFSTPIPDITKLGEKYMEIMKSMLNGNNTDHVFVASMNAMWQSGKQPYLSQKPDGCAIAQMINATVACYKYHKREPMLKALEAMASTMESNVNIIETTNIIASGCTPPHGSNPPMETTQYKLPRVSCFKNGYVYDIRDIWMYRGDSLPKELKNVVLKMYKSKVFSDNFLALVATNALLPMSSPSRFVNTSLQDAIQMTSLQLASKIPTCCCKSYIQRIQELTKGTKNTSTQLVKDEIKIYSDKDVCCPARLHPEN